VERRLHNSHFVGAPGRLDDPAPAGTSATPSEKNVCTPRGGKGYSSPLARFSWTRSCRACSSDNPVAKPRPNLAGPRMFLSQIIHLPCAAPFLKTKRDSVGRWSVTSPSP
jgi:hypothetical protein